VTVEVFFAGDDFFTAFFAFFADFFFGAGLRAATFFADFFAFLAAMVDSLYVV
jgi:hypothetical protein